MSMFEFLIAVLSLVPLGLLLLFWKVFPEDRDVHPIYREHGIETLDKRTEVQDPAARRPAMGEVEHHDKVA